MSIRTAIFCAAFALSAVAAPQFSHAGVNVDIDIAPPAPREEVVPAARAGFVWAPGYWNYNGHKHDWVGGHWEKEHHGQHYVPARWEQHDNHWRLQQGHWDH